MHIFFGPSKKAVWRSWQVVRTRGPEIIMWPVNRMLIPLVTSRDPDFPETGIFTKLGCFWIFWSWLHKKIWNFSIKSYSGATWCHLAAKETNFSEFLESYNPIKHIFNRFWDYFFELFFSFFLVFKETMLSMIRQALKN